MIFGKHINRYYLRYGWMLILGVIALVVVDVGQLKVPEFYRMVVNGINEGVVEVNGATVPFDMNFLLDKICLPMIYIILLLVVGRFTWRVCFFGAEMKMDADMRYRMFDHCKDLSQQYYQVNKVGNLMSLFTNDLDTVHDCFGSGVLLLGDAVVLGGLAFVKMIRMNKALTGFIMIPVSLIFAIGVVLSKYMSKKWDERQEVFSKLSDYTQESFSGIAVIKAFAKETLELASFKKLNKKNEKINVDCTKLSVLLNVLIVFFIETVMIVILGYGGYLVHEGVFKAGELVEFIGYFTSIIWPVEAVATLLEMTAKGKASLDRIGELLDAPIDVLDDEEKVKTYEADENAIKGDIEFKNLNFTYPGSEVEVLHDVSFKINAGENVGLIGKTGAGKTALVDLIARAYNVPDGTLFVDGMDVNTIPIRALRDHIAYVPQDNFLFSDTIANNISFAFDDSSEMEAIKNAAKRADIHKNISEFPNAYNTLLGERGVTVSGGQKQRISIARALMKQAEILILDDSVSAVDTKTEKVILDNLKETREGKTTILIAHRITTVEKMDKIIFVDEGKIVDVGTHEELKGRCQAYAEMVELQRLEDERKEREA